MEALTLRGDARVRRRRLVNRAAEGAATVAALAAVGVLGIVVWSVAKRGAGAVSLDLLTKDPSAGFSFTPVKQGLANENPAEGSFVSKIGRAHV